MFYMGQFFSRHFTAFFLGVFETVPAEGGGGGGPLGPNILMTTSGGGFFCFGGVLAFKRPWGLGGGRRTLGFADSSSSSRLRFAPPLGAGRRLLDAGFSSASRRGLLTPLRGGTIFERIAIEVARDWSAPMSCPRPADLSGLSALLGLRSRGRVPVPIRGAFLICAIMSLKLGKAIGGRSGSAGGAEGAGIAKPWGAPPEELEPPPICPV